MATLRPILASTLRLLLRPLRFSIRSFLVFTALCCLALGAWSLYVQPYRDQAASLSRLADLGGTTTSVGAAGPAWQRRLVEAFVGPQSFVEVRTADFRGRKITAEDIRSLSGLIYLQALRIDRAELNDENIAAIAQMSNLKELSMTYTKIGDDGLREVTRLPKLEKLRLTGVPVTDDGVTLLASMPSVNELFIRWTKITDEGAERLRTSLPNCKVHHHEALPVSTE
ncbi:leucine-rich repeat domain-containing protein [Lacipirellula limnantheis]|uniref:Leucine Rich repeats (2 copies) n=1 Tax=Lacipirellula limnantheis TaxID=2528024 RepID=A0A517TUS2_9BACT|nr:hypothetical protein [Lacipirellula limnantheis]QDT72126.1 Leucine Rich repeats (2 copies) [Lacipirellula limnantheis]